MSSMEPGYRERNPDNSVITKLHFKKRKKNGDCVFDVFLTPAGRTVFRRIKREYNTDDSGAFSKLIELVLERMTRNELPEGLIAAMLVARLR